MDAFGLVCPTVLSPGTAPSLIHMGNEESTSYCKGTLPGGQSIFDQGGQWAPKICEWRAKTVSQSENVFNCYAVKQFPATYRDLFCEYLNLGKSLDLSKALVFTAIQWKPQYLPLRAF